MNCKSFLTLKKKRVQKYLSLGNIPEDSGKRDVNFLILLAVASFDFSLIRAIDLEIENYKRTGHD